MPLISSKVSQNGFTLVEILLAGTVLSILTGILVSVINPTLVRQRAEDSIRRKNIMNLAESLETYRTAEGTYPQDTNSNGNPADDTTGLGFYIANWPNGQPTAATTYSYNVDAGGTVIGLMVTKSDGRVYKYRSARAWGKIVRECAGSAVINDNLCP